MSNIVFSCKKIIYIKNFRIFEKKIEEKKKMKHHILMLVLLGVLVMLSGFQMTQRSHTLAEAKRVRITKIAKEKFVDNKMNQKKDRLKHRLYKYKSNPSAYRMLIVYG